MTLAIASAFAGGEIVMKGSGINSCAKDCKAEMRTERLMIPRQ
jgi:hypothetical protein